MADFQYRPSPKPRGGLTTHAVLAERIAESTVTAAAAEAAGISAEQADRCIRGFLDRLMTAAAQSQWSDGLYDTLAFRPSSGGKGRTPDDFQTPDDLNAGVALAIIAPAVARWRPTLRLRSLGEVGLRTGVIATVLNMFNDRADQYTAGQCIKLLGHTLKLDPQDPAQGVFIRPGAGEETRLGVYGTTEPKSVVVMIPEGTTGPLTVRVACLIRGRVRSYTYGTVLTPSV